MKLRSRFSYKIDCDCDLQKMLRSRTELTVHNVVSFLYYTAGSCIFNDDLDSILYVPLLIVYSVGSGVVSPKLCNFGNLKLRWRLHQSQNMVARISVSNL